MDLRRSKRGADQGLCGLSKAETLRAGKSALVKMERPLIERPQRGGSVI
jgi:hypothetical protein